MSRTAYAASQTAGCLSRRRDVVGSTPPSTAGSVPASTVDTVGSDTVASDSADGLLPGPLDTCAAVAQLGTAPEVLPELVRLLEEATAGPVTLIARADLASPPAGVVLPIDGGRRGALVLRPTDAAWSDPTSAARIVLAQLLDRPAGVPSGETESVAGALVDSFEAERRELAERLHRGVLQALIGSRYLFDLARSAEGRAAVEALGMAREAVQEALAEGRALLRDVTPRVGDRGSLQEEAALLPGVVVSADGTGQLSPVVAATTYRLLQAISHLGRPVTVTMTDVDDRLRLTIGLLTDCDGCADRGPSATGAGSVTDGLASHLDRLQLIGVRVVEDGEHIVLDLPVVPRLPVQRAYRAAGPQSAGPTTSTTAQRPTQRAPRRSEGNP